MERQSKDQDVVKLLRKLKDTEAKYPEQMFVARRHMYLRRMAEIGMGIGVDTAIKETPKAPPPSSASPVTSTLLEAALVLAIVVEASAVAYFYREKLADFFQTITSEPRVQEVTSLPVASTAPAFEGLTPSPVAASLTPSVTLASPTLSSSPTGVSVTLTRTPIPGIAEEESSGSGGASQANSTPVPDGNAGNPLDHDDQGNHYGQTPQPERTIEPGGTNGNQSQDNGSNPAPQESGSDLGPGNSGKPPKNP
jgi:hypothetical protein